jgi:translation initiation factor 5
MDVASSSRRNKSAAREAEEEEKEAKVEAERDEMDQRADAGGREDDKMLETDGDVFFPNPIWIRKELLEQYVEPYLDDGYNKGGLKGALRNLKELQKAGALTEAQYKARKSALKKQDRANGGHDDDEDAQGVIGGGVREGGGGGGMAGTKVDKKGKKSTKSNDKGEEGGATSGGQAAFGGVAGGGRVPLNEIVLPKDGDCNIDGSVDAHYRYKMPAIQIKVEGETKMIRTVLTNMQQLAAAIGRPPSYLVTYLGQECSVMSQNAKPERDGPGAKAWLSGKHAQVDLQLLVFKFIRESVLCPACSNPETSISISGKRKKRAVMLTCGACGASSQACPVSVAVSVCTVYFALCLQGLTPSSPVTLQVLKETY